MTDEKTLDDILSELQKTLKVPKSRENKFGGYKYRSCEDILDAVKAAMPDGATLRITDEPVMVGEWHYMKATAEFSYMGESTVTFGFAREAASKKGMDEAQITGSASSYARKYALNGLFCIDDSADPDATNKHGKETVFETPQAMNQWVNNASKALGEAESLEALKDVFALYADKLKELAHGNDAEQIAYQDVVKAKDKRKLELSQAESQKIVDDVMADVLPESNYMAG